MRSRPMPMAPDWAISGSSAGISRLACSSTGSPSVVTAGSRRSLAELGAFLGEGGQGVAALLQRLVARPQHDGAGGPVEHRHVAALGAFAEPAGAEDGGDAERPQHDGGMAIGAALVRGDAGDAGRVEQGGIGGGEFLRHQDGALGHALQAAEGGGGEVAGQPAGDLPHLPGAALQPGLVVVPRGEDEGGDRLGLVADRGLGGQQLGLDALAGAAQQAGIAQHHHIGIEQRGQLLLRFLGQDGQPGLQLAELLAGQGGGLGQALLLGLDAVGGDGAAGGFGRDLRGVEDRADGDAGGDGDAADGMFAALAGAGLAQRLGGGAGLRLGSGCLGLVGPFGLLNLHGIRPRPGRRPHPGLRARPSRRPRSSPCCPARRRASSAP